MIAMIPVLLGAHCPACGFEHSFRIGAEYWAREGKDVWEWNGSWDKPTFVGSMLSRNPKRTRVCHSYLRDGVWEFLKDSTHAMAGQMVPMAPISEYHRD